MHYKDSDCVFFAEIFYKLFELTVPTVSGKVVLLYFGLECKDISFCFNNPMLKSQPAICAFNLVAGK